MTSKKCLLVYEAFDNTNVFLLKGNAAIEIDTEKSIEETLNAFTEVASTEARKIDKYARRVAIVSVIEL
ncbi:TPA: hypothetical protein SMT55_002685 [Proteus mirabilis]|uniref:hypothetical protein n=1 Tax=Proteus mirabilis TaxID=584 RepID=UPI0018C4AB0F|nr:hypothetical protein [Proteus mirabilis]HDT0722179.1 hypothetical protein [Proteus mirabilis]HEJ9412701.1 hypothetical protein [Proteus mirabilis]HEJ9662999.1 hypothetical protein [Proteus mirabilis]HEK1720647.1 hypothetical protein [Proteus mirabilis]